MPDIKISQLPQQSGPTINDKMPVTSGSITYYELISSIIALFFANYPATDPSITGWQLNRNNASFPTPSAVTYNGNRSYSLTFSGVDLTGLLSNGMRLRLTRTTSPPTQCTSLNGTTQYYSKTSPSGMTFTDDFVASAWVKLNAYNNSSQQVIASRFNNTSGWGLQVETAGNITLTGYNASNANFSRVSSYQSIPLNRWTHVAAQLDMSSFSATPTTSYIMINGVDVTATVTRAGTNPTALVQAGNLEIGSDNGGTHLFNGKIAQVAIYSAKVTQATVMGSISQGLSGSETSLVSAYSFSNSINDLNTSNANNLTANSGASATNADSPFSQQGDGTISNKDYAIVTSAIFSTDTTLTVQVPEGNAIPTSGGVSAVAYSFHKTPYQFPAQRGKWKVMSVMVGQNTQAGAVSGTWYNVGNHMLTVPIGEWRVSYQTSSGVANGSGAVIHMVTLSSGASTESNSELSAESYFGSFQTWFVPRFRQGDLSLAAATPYYLNQKYIGAGTATLYTTETTPSSSAIIEAELAYL